MANAKRDDNRVPTLIAALNTDGITPILIQANPSTHQIAVSDGTTGTDYPRTTDIRDQNRVTGLFGVSSVDGVTPVEIYADSSGNLLVNSM